MSEPSDRSGRPLTLTIHQSEASTPPPSLRRKRRQTSQSSDDRVGGTKSSPSRRRQAFKKEVLVAGPHIGSSRRGSSTMQRSTSHAQMSPELSSVAYTKTGRISKAKKGRKVHNCDCGRSYTRAEHLRRHQKNHAKEAMSCEFPDCGKTFYRIDLLQRHRERHDETGKVLDSPRPSIYSPASTEEPEPQVAISDVLLPSIVTTGVQNTPYYLSTASSLPETVPDSSIINQKQPYHTHQISAPIQIPIEGFPASITYDSFRQSPDYSSSSGYASPVPVDFTNVFAKLSYGASARPRTSSDASFIPPWEFPSRSPASATSTVAYTWTSNDKSSAPANLTYLTTSYPMTSLPDVEQMSAYGHFDPKFLAQRDEEEQAFLFPEQSFGMGQLANTYPFEQYLDNYWRLFHPTFPVVHRPTFDGINEPPMLQAAMIAVGGQYSNDPSVKRKSHILHDRCTKLLEKRNFEVVVEPERLRDQQALFLVEILSQYRARRAAQTLSTRFEGLYQKLCQDSSIVASSIVELVCALVRPENATYERWSQWVNLAGKQRLLLCCYILECQQTTLLARSPRQSIVQLSDFDLPIPAHSALWDASSPAEWAMASQQYSHLPAYVCDVDSEVTIGLFDCFQSSLLITSRYDYFNSPTSYLGSPALHSIDHLLDDSSVTRHQLLTAKLVQITPIRALLAVSGKSWILSHKVPSRQAFLVFKDTLRTWVNGLWAPTDEPHHEAAHEALKLAIELLRHAINSPVRSLRLELGADMGLYFAALVIWAVTVAANARTGMAQTQVQAPPQRYESHSPHPSMHFPSTPTRLSFSTPQPSQSPNPAHPTATGLLHNPHTSPASHPTSTSMLHSDFTMDSMSFLNKVLLELDCLGTVAQWPRDVSQWQQGCAALMCWVKMRLRNGTLEGQDSGMGHGPTSTGTGLGGDALGDLLDGVIGVLGKLGENQGAHLGWP